MKHSCNQEETFTDGQRLRLLSYNIQVGSTVNAYRQYITKSWEHILPSSGRMENLSHIARMVSDYDLVGLQEVDAGSLRSGFINQTEYLADKARFPFWHHQTNRKIGRIAQHSNGFMSKFKPAEIYTHKLPGTISGRGALCARFGGKEESLIVIILHLALGKRSRMQQMSYISELAQEHEHVIIMGDMNCRSDSPEIMTLQKKANLCEPVHDLHTFPSWAPERNIDHILVSPSLKVESIHVLNHTFSDHLPIAMDVILPDTVRLAAS
ncbi:MAG: endonuclease/exonuclease/phosphatase family protein [Gammaproteobacteria bacterium]|nr:endonuclease/exonuclease/phosphatase family protein [Gammaproteobacteria bacterium]